MTEYGVFIIIVIIIISYTYQLHAMRNYWVLGQGNLQCTKTLDALLLLLSCALLCLFVVDYYACPLY